MPVSRRDTEQLARIVSDVYAQAETHLLRLIAKHLAAGVEAPHWAEVKLAELQLFQRRAQAVVKAARGEAVGQLVAVLERAYLRGAAAGQGDVDALDRAVELPIRHAERATAALVSGLTGQLETLDVHVVRQVADIYRTAVVQAAAIPVAGAGTRLQAAQSALDKLAKAGVSGFTDTAGRNWNLTSYVEMATRTTTAQAAVQGHLDRLEDAGIPLVIVSDSPRECERCRPWEGKVLARGPVPAIMGNAVTGESMRVQVDGTVADAMSGGLLHPNCTHNLSAYIPGATRLGREDANPAGYAAQVRQRDMERRVREWKRREAVALSPEAAAAARVKVRQWQGEIRAHVKAHGLPRKLGRESLTAAR